MTKDEAIDNVNAKLRTRTDASQPRIDAKDMRDAVAIAIEYADGRIEFHLPNGDRQRIITDTQPGQGLLQLRANLVAGSSAIDFINANQASRGFMFWLSRAGMAELQLQLALIEGRMGIGTYEPDEALHVEGRAKLWGLVAGGGTPVLTPGAAAGNGATTGLLARSCDYTGRFSITTGATPTTTGVLARLAYSATTRVEPVGTLLTAVNRPAAREIAKVSWETDSNKGMVLYASEGAALSANTTFVYSYHINV